MQECNILVSIIVPIYNVENYLSTCLESIIQQTYKNIEVILVNDGSTDNSGKIAEEYSKKYSNIKVIHKKNNGVSSARNTGIAVAQGKYLCFSDADDWLANDYVEYLLTLAVNNDAEIVYTNDMFTTFKRKQIAKDKITVYNAEQATSEILCYNVPIGVYSKLFKKEFLINNSIQFYPDIYIGEGFNFNTACFQRANKIVMAKRKIYFYRRDNTESAMSKFNIKKCQMALYAINKIREDLIIKTPTILKSWEFAYWHTHCDMYCWIKNSKNKKLYPDIYKKCKNISQNKALIAFKLPTKRIDRIRAILSFISPSIVAKLLLLRNKHQI